MREIGKLDGDESWPKMSSHSDLLLVGLARLRAAEQQQAACLSVGLLTRPSKCLPIYRFARTLQNLRRPGQLASSADESDGADKWMGRRNPLSAGKTRFLSNLPQKRRGGGTSACLCLCDLFNERQPMV